MSPSRTGKTTGISIFIKKFLNSLGNEADVFVFDVKNGEEFVDITDLPNVHVLSPDQPEAYTTAISKLHAKAKRMAKFKSESNCRGSFYMLWRERFPGSTRYRPTIICVDEFVEQIEIGKEDPPEIKDQKLQLKLFIQKALRRYANVGFHVILATQSARAIDRGLLDSATDNISFSIIGRQDIHMANTLKIPELYTDQEIQTKPGVFIFKQGSRRVKFYVD